MGLSLSCPPDFRRSANQRCMECAEDCLLSETFNLFTNVFRQPRFQSSN
jgi:hypothetical protein